MKNGNFTQVKKNKPVSLIVHSTNTLGYNLAKTLAEQGSQVILLDQFDSQSKKSLLELKKFGQVDFVDLKGLENLIENIGKVDYLFYIQSDYLLSNDVFESKDFLQESNNLNLCLKVVQKYNAKFSLITTIAFNEKLIHAMENLNYSKPSPYSAEELQKYSETLVAEYHDKAKINARILRMGTIIGAQNNIEFYPQINQLFEDSIKSNSINIQGEGLDINYLIDLQDAIYGILKLTFSTKTNGEVISLCNNNEYTILSIAYKLLELNPEATEIKFVPETNKKPIMYTQYIPAPNAENYGWKQQRTLEKSMADTLSEKYKKYRKKWTTNEIGEASYNQKLEEIRQKKLNQQGENTSTTTKTSAGETLAKVFKPFSRKRTESKTKTPVKHKIKNIALILLTLIAFYFLIYPIISMSISVFSIYNVGRSLANDYANIPHEEATAKLENINQNTTRLSNNFTRLQWLFTTLQAQEMHRTTSTLFYALEEGSEGLLELHKGAQPLLIYIEEFEPAMDFQEGAPRTTREYTQILRDLERNTPQIEQAVIKISQSSRSIDQLDLDIYPRFLNTQIETIEYYNEILKQQVLPLDQIISFLPETLGVNERKRYLILLQNPAELRSTGGWISSYALIGVEGGQIRELDVDDVYNLDGELINKEKFFDAPEHMQNALDIEEWNLSLSNWNPNFPDAANDATFFVKEAEVASKIDGVITIDIFFLQSLLSKWGGIQIPGETDIITSENIYEKIFNLQQDFSPGQSQKATFLANLANETLKKLLSSNMDEYALVIDAIIDSLHSKNILLSMQHNRAQQYFTEQGWTGAISTDTHANAPFSIEWNWAANKSNLYLDREEKIQMEIMDTNNVRYTYTLLLRNNSPSETYPYGEYTNYLRVYIPENAEIISTQGFENNNYENYYENGFQVLGGWFNIPIQTTQELTVQYANTSTTDMFDVENDKIATEINLFKQPGTSKNDKIRLEIMYPEIWSVLEQGDFDKIGKRLTQEMFLEQDKTFKLDWTHR